MNADLIRSHRVVPVIVIDDPAAAEPLADSLVDGGLPIAEITFRTDEAASAIAKIRDHGGVTVGAGTVVTPAQVDEAVDAGAEFIVSPGFRADVVQRCAERDVFALPGVSTATDIMAALASGVDVVKFFPAGTSGGSKAVAALAAPFPSVSFVPTGGIDATSAGDYLRLPSVLAVGGSWMVPRQAIADGEFDRVRDLVAASVAAVSDA